MCFNCRIHRIHRRCHGGVPTPGLWQRPERLGFGNWHTSHATLSTESAGTWEITFTFQVTDEKKPFTRWGVMSTVSHSGCSPMRGHTVPRTSLLTLKTGTHLYPQRKYSYGIFSGMLQSKSYDFALGLMCRAVEGAHKERVWMAYLKILDADLSRQESFILGKNYLAPPDQISSSPTPSWSCVLLRWLWTYKAHHCWIIHPTWQHPLLHI